MTKLATKLQQKEAHVEVSQALVSCETQREMLGQPDGAVQRATCVGAGEHFTSGHHRLFFTDTNLLSSADWSFCVTLASQ